MEMTDYVSYDLALKLKACGFDEPCDHYYEATHWERTACFPLKRKEPERYKTYKTLVKKTPEINLREEYGITNSVFVSREDVINLTPNDGVIRRSVFASAPTLAHAQKWLREKRGIDVDVRTTKIPKRKYGYVVYDKTQHFSHEEYCAYEQALSVGISAALELIKKGE